MSKLGIIAVFGMFIAVIGMGHLGENARPLAWGLALSIAVIVHWVNSLQKQMDQLKSTLNQSQEDANIKPGDCRTS